MKPPSDDFEFDIEQFLEEYRQTLGTVAKIAVTCPDQVDSLRDSLKLSAMLLITNKPGLKDAFQEAVEEMDDFLERCKKGEIDPRDFLTAEIQPTD